MHFLMLGMLVLLLAGAGKITAKAESAKQESTTAESAETESAKPVAVVQDDAGLLIFVLEDVVARDHDDQAGQRRRNDRQNKAQLYAAEGRVVCEQTGY